MTGIDIANAETTQALIRAALAEDVGSGDVTSIALVPETALATAHMVARESCVLAGGPIAQAVFGAVDADLETTILQADGSLVAAGTPVARIAGPARGLLTAERVALNFFQRLSGIATLTHRYVEETAGTGVSILDTQKTTPGYRALEKYAVSCGGGNNHRMGLYDRVMIKDNHLAFWCRDGDQSFADAVAAAREKYPDLLVQIEVDTLQQLEDALRVAPDWVLLDNMTPDLLRQAVLLCDSNCSTEASGGITLDTVGAVARTGVDAISIGALTHSARAVDLALDFS